MTDKTGKNAREAALKMLARRDYAAAAMRRKLKQKGFGAGEISEALVWLERKKLINDREYAGAYVRSVLAQKNVGRRWLVFKMRQQGLDAAIISRALEENYPPAKEAEYLLAAAASWRRQHGDTPNERDKLARFLMSRGFSHSEEQ